MVHNFTQENHSNVSRFFVAINPDANDRVIALAQQFRGKHSRVLARIGGSGLVDSIIREHSRMASVKRSARQQIDAVFSNMSAADIPYGQTTLSDLNSANSLIATFLNALGIAVADVKAGGIDNIDRSVRYLASNLTVSDVDYWPDANTDDISLTLQALADATKGGYNTIQDSTNPVVLEVWEKISKTEGLSDEQKSKLFASACMTKALQLSYDYGSANSTPLSYDETYNVGKSIKSHYNDYVSRTDGDYCISFMLSNYAGTKIYSDIQTLHDEWKPYKLSPPWSPLTTSSSTHGALTGMQSRTLLDKEIERDDKTLQDNVVMAVSIGKNETFKIKLPGEDEYIEMFNPADYGLSLDEQRQIIGMSGVTGPLDMVFTNSKKDKKNLRHGPDYAQNHGIILLSPSSYAGVNSPAWPSKQNPANFIKNYSESNSKNVIGFDYIIVNNNNSAIQDLSNEYSYINQSNEAWE